MTTEVTSTGASHLWLVRHAQPLIAPGICYGKLDVAAQAQATRDCAQALARVIPRGLAVLTSPLKRCEQLMLVFKSLRPDLTYKIEPRLQEMNFGNWEGRAWSDIARAELEAWTSRFNDYKTGQNGESVARFMTRVAAVFDELPAGTDCLWITHAGVIRAAQLLASGVRQIDRADQWPIASPAYGQWCKLSLQS